MTTQTHTDTLQQSSRYADFIRKLKWNVVQIQGMNIFIKWIPLTGHFAKLQRIGPLPDVQKVIQTLKQYKVRQAVIEANESVDEQTFRQWTQEIKKHIHVLDSPYLATKTIRIDLTKSEDHIFADFTQAKRRAVRRAQKNALSVEINQDISTVIQVKNVSAGFLGFITTKGLKELWEAFTPDACECVVVYNNEHQKKSPVACIFLLYHNEFAYYWIAGATKKGKKLFAPGLAAWEAIRSAKKHGASYFDWIGIFDDRFPNEHHDWKGFTKFKEGFGGTSIYYPVHRTYKNKLDNQT